MKLLIQPLYLIHSHHLSMFHGRFARHLFVYLPLFLKEEGEPQNDLTLCGGSIIFIYQIVCYRKKRPHLCVFSYCIICILFPICFIHSFISTALISFTSISSAQKNSLFHKRKSDGSLISISQ